MYIKGANDNYGLMKIRCSCGRDTKSFEACSPTGCKEFIVCIGCYKEIDVCVCKT